MTVKELIEILEKLSPEKEVIGESANDGSVFLFTGNYSDIEETYVTLDIEGE